MKQLLILALGAAVVFLALVLPNHPGTMSVSALNRFPLELPVLIFAMIAIGRRWGVPFCLALLLIGTTFLKLADYVMFTAYNRTFNPVLDMYLLEAGIGLLSDSIGRSLAYLVIAVFCFALIVWFFLLLRSLQAWAALPMSRTGRAMAAGAAVVFGGWAVADTGHHLEYWAFDKSPPGTAWTSRLTFKRVVMVQETVEELALFSAEAATDPYADRQGLLDRLAGRDVVLIYIESYGRASFDNPLYAPKHLATLKNAQDKLTNAGFDMRSGWLTSPTTGGQSWLAHGTLASGLWTSDNGRYTAMLASGHRWLFHFARDAGYRTSAIMPAITIAWPESSRMGFDLIFAAEDIPYRGERFNWVTMPDQFTLAAYPELLPEDPRPDFIQIALISSHAPWVPIPEMVDWDTIGDGTIFNQMADSGPTPRELWKDRDAVRDAYRRAVDYSLKATFEHIAQLGPKAPLVIVAGDHQAAGFVAGSDNEDVAVHLIGPPSVLAMIDSWGWQEGLVPTAHTPVRRMDTFRNDFLDAFSSAPRIAEVSR